MKDKFTVHVSGKDAMNIGLEVRETLVRINFLKEKNLTNIRSVTCCVGCLLDTCSYQGAYFNAAKIYKIMKQDRPVILNLSQLSLMAWRHHAKAYSKHFSQVTSIHNVASLQDDKIRITN